MSSIAPSLRVESVSIKGISFDVQGFHSETKRDFDKAYDKGQGKGVNAVIINPDKQSDVIAFVVRFSNINYGTVGSEEVSLSFNAVRKDANKMINLKSQNTLHRASGERVLYPEEAEFIMHNMILRGEEFILHEILKERGHARKVTLADLRNGGYAIGLYEINETNYKKSIDGVDKFITELKESSILSGDKKISEAFVELIINTVQGKMPINKYLNESALKLINNKPGQQIQ